VNDAAVLSSDANRSDVHGVFVCTNAALPDPRCSYLAFRDSLGREMRSLFGTVERLKRYRPPPDFIYDESRLRELEVFLPCVARFCSQSNELAVTGTKIKSHGSPMRRPPL